MGSVTARNKEMPSFFGEVQLKGEKQQIAPDSDIPELYYKHPNGELWKGDSIKWLKSLEDESVDMIFADPPYNIKKADWDSFENQEEYIKWSMLWIEETARILKPKGTLFICGFS